MKGLINDPEWLKDVEVRSSEIEETLASRDEIYGDFAQVAETAQALKSAIPDWDMLSPVHREALDLICTKIARIASGRSDYRDNWHDIAGYATLAERSCK